MEIIKGLCAMRIYMEHAICMRSANACRGREGLTRASPVTRATAGADEVLTHGRKHAMIRRFNAGGPTWYSLVFGRVCALAWETT